MALKRFPIGVQDFAVLREDKKYYVDKTDLVYKMVSSDRYYFLSRPRRFGKSLLVSTLQCYFEGRKDLFTGLAIEKLETEWKTYPVIRLDMSIVKYSSKNSLAESLNKILEPQERRFNVKSEPDNHTWGVRMARIIEAAHEQSGKEVVVLIDEYDAPMLDTFGMESFDDIRIQVRSLYSPLKALGGILRFVFLTGISKFSQLSIFSELNNLNVITMNDEYAAICGITKEELLTQMQPEIQALADKNGLTYEEACNALTRQYDGYHFSEESPDIFNPFSLISSLNEQKLKNYWFATGTPTILTKLVKKYQMDAEQFDKGFAVAAEVFDAPTETAQNPIPMLYQSGYLTIKKFHRGKFAPYVLAFPNNEVAEGFTKSLLAYYTKQDTAYSTVVSRVIQGMNDGDVDSVLQVIKAYMSGVPYDAEAQNELHYKTIVYCVFSLATPYLTRCEEKSAAGRCDVVVETANAVYMFEFKLDGKGTVDEALKQIEDKGYLIPYTASFTANGAPKKLNKIGVTIDTEKRTIGEWKVVEG
ncbi:AAA family ATPase [Fibrobacter sp.]|uniref:ATP-binding protein n=1 Tax=Fibrobacter sp. TaxID=35828 RepID=UPI00386542DB